MRDWRRDAGIFAAGAGCGLLAGAFLVAAIVWFYDALGTRAITGEPRPDPVAHWERGMDDAATPAADRHRGLTGTSGTEPAIDGATDGADAATIAPPAGSPTELAARALAMPVQGVSRDALTRQFQDRRGAVREHEAIDILAPRNTPVVAVEDGRIARLFFSKAGGITIYQFDPTERYCYYYAHLERYADGLREGEMVRKGQVIGYVGTSGNAPETTPHLHFAVFRLTADKHWWEGTAIDPYDILRR